VSTFKVEVVRVRLEPHPNADRLELAKVRGWQCCVVKGQFQEGGLGIYIPVDAVLPEALIDSLGIRKNYHKRLRTIKLRGMVSQGLLISAGPDNTEGQDVTEALGITKYDPPIPVHMAGIVRPEHACFRKYTDIENWKNFPDLLRPGEEVIVTEKVHGTNFRAGKFDGELHVGSHRLSLMEDPDNLYWRAAALLGLKERLAEGEILYAEIYGQGVQDLTYGKKPGQLGVIVFDIIRDNRYLDCAAFAERLAQSGWQDLAAPILYRGPWSSDILKLAAGDSVLCPGQIREGVVIRPAVERFDPRTGRVILKALNDDYLLRKDATEHH
jgi:RNA ligase (TIGR02306 family)